jgi:hypothetical protein
MRLRDQAATFELRTQLRWSDQLLETPETTAFPYIFQQGAVSKQQRERAKWDYLLGVAHGFGKLWV